MHVCGINITMVNIVFVWSVDMCVKSESKRVYLYKLINSNRHGDTYILLNLALCEMRKGII